MKGSAEPAIKSLSGTYRLATARKNVNPQGGKYRERNPEKDRQVKRAYRFNQKLKGLCKHCTEPIFQGDLCERHVNKRLEYEIVRQINKRYGQHSPNRLLLIELLNKTKMETTAMKKDTVNDFKDLPKILPNQSPPALVSDTPDRKPIDLLKELVVMVTDIHRVLCPVEAKPEKAKPKRPHYRDKIVDHMKHGEVYIAEDFLTLAIEWGAEKPTVQNINAALTALALKSRIVRVRNGIYKLPDEHKPVEEAHGSGS